MRVRILLFIGIAVAAWVFWDGRSGVTPPVSTPPVAEAPAVESPAERSAAPSPASPAPVQYSPAAESLLQADARGDRESVVKTINELVRKGRGGDDGAVRELAALLEAFPPEKQRFLVLALGRIATPASLSVLLELADSAGNRSAEVRSEILGAIREIGRHQDEQGRFPAELSPLLEKHLPAALADSERLSAVAGGIASIGTASGIQALLDAVESQPGTEASRQIALALKSVRNPDAVPPLAQRLRVDPDLNGEPGRAAAYALAAISQPESTDALLAWAADLSGEAATEAAQELFLQVRDPASLDLLAAAPDRLTFRDPRVRTTVRDVVSTLGTRSQPQIDRD